MRRYLQSAFEIHVFDMRCYLQSAFEIYVISELPDMRSVVETESDGAQVRLADRAVLTLVFRLGSHAVGVPQHQFEIVALFGCAEDVSRGERAVDLYAVGVNL